MTIERPMFPPVDPTRRRFLTVAAAGAVAALPLAAPAIGAERPDDYAAMLARAEQTVETLRTQHVADGWTLFEPAAEQMLNFFRRRKDGRPEGDNEFTMDVVEFFGAHRQSLDWVIFGDPGVMICRLAAAKSQERGERDVELLALVDDYIAAEAASIVRDLLAMAQVQT